ncbi:zona pellucida sperm-binding protein 3 receptor-like [Carettochelys insculpta]|uniref:zona pellucida sperm-binding protein 3 receptor-like n=1 Tax=Carettochelys insculpta TaxID=44489 RepID=UPI003EBE4B1B
MASLNPGKQHYYLATIPLLLVASFVVAVHSDCGVPPRFNFAELKEEHRYTDTFPVGSIVDYSCRPGYRRVSRTSLRCNRNSQWSSSLSDFCWPKSCPYPGEPENGRVVVETNLMFGATIHFTCEDGYRLIGSAQSKCVLQGSDVTWDKANPYCQLIPCMPPPVIEHGGHTGTIMEVFNYGTAVTYECNSVERGQIPFSLIGEASIYCTSTDKVNGHWSGPAPQCKVVRCEQPKVDHGIQVTGYSPVYTYRASVSFACKHRYTLKGSSLLQCNEHNRWDPELPVCERSSCDDPPHIDHTSRNDSESTLFPAGTVVTYKCVRGYELMPRISSASVTCQEDFTWSRHQNFCQKVPCPDPNITNGKVKERYIKAIYKFEDRIEVECNDGYVLKSYNTWSTCKHEGEWDPELPVCEPVCKQPARIPNGKVTYEWQQTFPIGSTVTYSCARGWSLFGEASLQCIAGDGGVPRWDPHAPECRVCKQPARIPNGKVTYEWQQTFPIGSTVTYSCARGWSLFGEASLQCIAGDGGVPRWDPHAPECREVRCPALEVSNGTRTLLLRPGEETHAFGDVVAIECAPGYGIKGSTEASVQIRCKHDGTWDPAMPVCEPVCGPPPNISHGHYSTWGKSNFVIGSLVTYKCDTGFSLVGGATIHCTAGDEDTPTWGESTPQCEEVRCPTPVIENGRQISAAKAVYTYANHIVFQCDPGYVLQGHEEIVCRTDGSWYPPVPFCDKIQCAKPDVQNGRVDSVFAEKMWYNVNESVTLKCSSGYHFSDLWYLPTTDTSRIICLANGNWTAIPKCKKHSNSEECTGVRESKEFLHCDVPLTELRTLLEVKKLYLEIQKLKKEIKNLQ